MSGSEFWAVRYSGDIWITHVDPAMGLSYEAGRRQRHRFASREEARRVAREIVHGPVVVVRVAMRPKSKPAPALKVGDEVLVRAKLIRGDYAGAGGHLLEAPSQLRFCVKDSDIVREGSK